MKLSVICLFVALDLTISQSLKENAVIKQYLESLEKFEYRQSLNQEFSESNVNVTCSMHFLDIHKVDEENMELQATFYFRQSWIDPRLAYSNQDIQTITLDDSKLIWTPDTHFDLQREGFLHKIIKPNIFIKIDKDGTVFHSARLTGTFRFLMDFHKYPHDTQKFDFKISSATFDTEFMQVSWKPKNPAGVGNYASIPYEVKIVGTDKQTDSYEDHDFEYLLANLTFQRKTGYFVTKLYLPYIFLTALSWLTFWIPTKMALHRLCLLFLIIYFMGIIGKEINAVAPKTPYMKGSDVWIAACKILVLASFLEFILVNVVEVKKADSKIYMNDSTLEVHSSTQDVSNKIPKRILARFRLENFQSEGIEATSRIIFPVLFISFNLIYWIIY